MLRRAFAVLLVASLTIPAAALAQTPQASLPDIEDEVMCIVCGVSLELATESPQANQERDLIRSLIAEGLTKDEIKARLVDQYGENVLAIPGTDGFDLAAWLVPGAAILLAGVGIVIGLRRWRRAGTHPNGGGSAGPEPPADLDPADAGRLDADLARYEL